MIEENFPVMIHCTHGKDRTGVIIMLLLLLCNVPTEVCTAFQCSFVSVRVFYGLYHGYLVAPSD